MSDPPDKEDPPKLKGSDLAIKLKVMKEMDSSSFPDLELATLTDSSSDRGNEEKSDSGMTVSEVRSDRSRVETGEGSTSPDHFLATKSNDELIEIIEYLRLKTTAQEHKMEELNEDKNQAVAIATEHAVKEEEYSQILISLGEHPDQKAQLHDVNRERCTEFDRNAPLDPSPEDLDALSGFTFHLTMFQYIAKPKFEDDGMLVKTHYQEISGVILEAGELKSYNRLGMIILKEAQAQRRDMNVIIALQLAPKLEEKPYMRVLHPTQFSTWIKKMAALKPCVYDLHAYLYTDAEADEAYDRLEVDTRILKY
ncbi:hypothetical protein DV738_g4549, partial [Chaetothyriales sp. CBS 135597]